VGFCYKGLSQRHQLSKQQYIALMKRFAAAKKFEVVDIVIVHSRSGFAEEPTVCVKWDDI